MREDEFFALFGEIDGKYYEEARRGKKLLTEELTPFDIPKKRPVPLFRIGAVLGAGLISTCLLIYLGANKGGGEKDNIVPPDISFSESVSSQKENTGETKEVSEEELAFIRESLKEGTETEEQETEISASLLYIDFDGDDEIIAACWTRAFPIYVFERGKGEILLTGSFAEDENRACLNKSNFGRLIPCINGEEKYYCYSYKYVDDSINARGAAAIRYEDEKGYYTENLLTYGKKRDSSGNWNTFFRKGDGEKAADIGYEDFSLLWEQYEGLPVISFYDINQMTETKREKERHDLTYSYGTYNMCYSLIEVGSPNLIDKEGNIRNLEGESQWEAEYDPFEIDFLMSRGSTEKLGAKDKTVKYRDENINIENGISYQVDDYCLLVLWNPPAEEQEAVAFEYDPSEYYNTALFLMCRGHMGALPLEIDKIPDIKGSGTGNIGLSEVELSIYSALYPNFNKSLLFSEEKNGYRFETVATGVTKDSSADPNRLYFGNVYTLISKVGDDRVMGKISTDIRSLSLDEDYSSFRVEMFELKDGTMFFLPNASTGVCSSQFFAVDKGKNGLFKVYCLTGDSKGALLKLDPEPGNCYLTRKTRKR